MHDMKTRSIGHRTAQQRLVQVVGERWHRRGPPMQLAKSILAPVCSNLKRRDASKDVNQLQDVSAFPQWQNLRQGAKGPIIKRGERGHALKPIQQTH